MKRMTKKAMGELLAELRSVAPRRPLTYGESLHVARRQADHLRQWVGAAEADINLIWLVEQRAVPVHMVASYKLGEESALTTDELDGKLQIFINRGDSPQRKRFSLLHEFKHVLDFPDAKILHARLGQGNRNLGANMVEWVANEFAAHVLMPTMLVKRVWFACQDLEMAASMFNVSMEAMANRLERLGLTGEAEPAPRVYFRRTALLGGSGRDEPLLPTVANAKDLFRNLPSARYISAGMRVEEKI